MADRVIWLAFGVAAVGGAAAAVAPLITVGLTGAAVVVVGLIALGERSRQAFLVALAGLLAIYAFMGRGGAYIGIAPVYISEILFAIGALTLVLNVSRLRIGFVHLALILFMGWGFVRTVPYLGTFGIDALRDAVFWAYGLFALAVAAAMRTIDFGTVVRWYRRVIPAFVVVMPLVAVVSRVFADSIPKWPNTPEGGVGIIFFSNGQTAVHMAGIGAFVLVGLFGISRRNRILEPFVWMLWLVGVAIVSSFNRGSLLAASMSGLAVGFVRSRTRMMSVALVAPILLSVLAVVNPVFDLGAVRKVSFDQLTQNVVSIFVKVPNDNLVGTTKWRLAWWQTIIDYTINGAYFWDGKGFGVNLADVDGFQVNIDGSLRAPHNGHFAILARAGVPGLTLWILLQASYAIGLLRAAIGAHRLGRAHWVAILAWLFVYWVAAMVNMSFDPYLEGPHGGIWFWSLFGLGLVAMRAWRADEAADRAVAVAATDDSARERATAPPRIRSGAGDAWQSR